MYLRNDYIFIALLFAVLVSACVQKTLAVSDVAEKRGDLLNQDVSVEGIAGMGKLRCTLMACPEENPCCNRCGGSLALTDSKSSVEIRGLGAGCSGSECSQTCHPLKQGKKYIVTGTLKESYGELYIELKSLREI